MPDPTQKRARKPRAITPLLRDAAPLIMLASALFYTNRWLTLTDDEASFLSAAITWQYFRCMRSRLFSHWITFCVLALALLYTNDFGWALLILLGVDYGWRIPEAKIDGPNDAPESARPRSRRKIEEILAT